MNDDDDDDTESEDNAGEDDDRSRQDTSTVERERNLRSPMNEGTDGYDFDEEDEMKDRKGSTGGRKWTEERMN